jgi:hypothetical protein
MSDVVAFPKPTTPAPAARAANLELNYMRAALIEAGALPLPKLPLPPEPPMTLREALGRAFMCAWPCAYDPGPEADWEHLVGRDVDELLHALVLVVTPPASQPN